MLHNWKKELTTSEIQVQISRKAAEGLGRGDRGRGVGGRPGLGAGTDVSVTEHAQAGCWEQSRLLMAGQKVTATKGEEAGLGGLC